MPSARQAAVQGRAPAPTRLPPSAGQVAERRGAAVTGAGAAGRLRWGPRPAWYNPRRGAQLSAGLGGPRGEEPSPPAPAPPAGAGSGRAVRLPPRSPDCSPFPPHLRRLPPPPRPPHPTWRSTAASDWRAAAQRKRKGNGVHLPPSPSPPSFPPRQAAAAGPRAGGTGAQALLPGRALLRHGPQRRSGAGATGSP